MVNMAILIIDILSLIFTIFLMLYGFAKGFDLIELIVYVLWMITTIISQFWTIRTHFNKGESE
jgi:hypothetical protein